MSARHEEAAHRLTIDEIAKLSASLAAAFTEAITVEADAFSLATFCARHGISPQLFYKFRKEMPVTFTIGTRVLISREAAAKWRAERTEAEGEAAARKAASAAENA